MLCILPLSFSLSSIFKSDKTGDVINPNFLRKLYYPTDGILTSCVLGFLFQYAGKPMTSE
ncbi:MAG: hypothetical protein IPO37_23845 [Saprospiraceae bacterium]|nr:hypothetical protein [Saprospiraceae bacterium]